jgi:hypothetical protein
LIVFSRKIIIEKKPVKNLRLINNKWIQILFSVNKGEKMVKKRIKSTLVASMVLAMVACTSPVANNTPVPQKESFQDLDREYVFNTKELTQSYLQRKLEKWLCMTDNVNNPPSRLRTLAVALEPVCTGDGYRLVKEILYAMYKHPDTFRAIVAERPDILVAINLVQQVQDRRVFDLAFAAFLDGEQPGGSGGGSGSSSIGEFLINTNTVGGQYLSSVGMDGAGDFVVAWVDKAQDGSYYGVYARRYESTGVPKGPEFMVSNHPTGYQINPAVAMDDAGDFIIVWNSYQSGPQSLFDVYAKRYDSNGDPVPIPVCDSSIECEPEIGEFRVNSITAESQIGPAVSMNSSGDFIIAWSGPDGNDTGVYARRFYNTGEPKETADFRVNTYTNRYQTDPTVAMDNAGDFVVAWSSYQNIDEREVFARRYDSNGDFKIPPGECTLPSCNPDTGEFQVNTYTLERQIYPAAAMDDAGDFVITWSSFNSQDGDRYGVYAHKYDNNGNTVIPQDCSSPQCDANSGEFRANTNIAGGQVYSTVAMDSDGDFVITWTSYFNQDGDNSGVFAKKYDSAGASSGLEFQVNSSTTGGQMFSTTAMDDNGDFVVTWTDYGGNDGNNYGVFGKRYNSSGEAQQAP